MSSNPEELFLIKKDKQEEINIDNDKKETEETSKTLSSASSSSSEEEKVQEKDEEEDEDGFRTPTTLDHKITVLTCPPAPKKTKQSLKRRAVYCNCRQLPLDLSKEVELLLQTQHIPFTDLHGAKKIRRDNNQKTTK
ncbi:unnamed protein product [Lathyrus sativus]|nr:unnamed protein product [Lathyrus sativus]